MKAVIFRFEESEPNVGLDNRKLRDVVFPVPNFNLETIQKLPCYYQKNWFKLFFLDGLEEIPVLENPSDLEHFYAYMVKVIDKTFAISLLDFVSLTEGIPSYYIKGYKDMEEGKNLVWNNAIRKNPNLSADSFQQNSMVFYGIDSGKFYFQYYDDGRKDATVFINEFDPNYRPNIYDAIGLARKKSLKNEDLKTKFMEYCEFFISYIHTSKAPIKEVIEQYPFDFASYNLDNPEQIIWFIRQFRISLWEDNTLDLDKRKRILFDQFALTYRTYLEYLEICNTSQQYITRVSLEESPARK